MAILIFIKPANDAHDISVCADGDVKANISKKHREMFKINEERLIKAIYKLRMKEDELKGKTPVSAYIGQLIPWLNNVTCNWQNVKIFLRVVNTKIINIDSDTDVAACQKFTNNSHKPAKFTSDIQEDLNSITTSWETTKKLDFNTNIDYNVNVLGSTGVSYPSSLVTVQLDPGQRAVSNLRVTRNFLTLKVIYEASLEGHVACSFTNLFRRINRNYNAIDILTAANLPPCVTASEEINICFYTDGTLIISNE